MHGRLAVNSVLLYFPKLMRKPLYHSILSALAMSMESQLTVAGFFWPVCSHDG